MHPADRHRAADVEEARLLLAVDADVVAPEPVVSSSPGRLEGEAGPLVELGAEPLGPELLGQVAHAGQAPVLAVAELAEELGDAAAQLDRLVGTDEDVDVGRHPLAVGEAAADEHVEAERAVGVLGRPQADVVDLDPGAVLAAAGDGDLELARQVGVLAVAGEEGRDRLGDRAGVEDLVGVDARHRARADVARRVATRLHGGQPDLPEALPDPGTSSMRIQCSWMSWRVVRSA